MSKLESKNSDEKQASLVLSMPLFNSSKGYSLAEVVADLKSHWKLSIESHDGDDTTATLNIEGATVIVAYMDVAVPSEEIENIAPYNYLWKNALEECKSIQAHAIVSVLQGQSALNIIDLYKILTKVNASILRTSDAIGIYQGSQTLLLPKSLYLEYADALLEDQVPVILWVYVGFFKKGNRTSIYTYGMKEFQKSEIEIIESKDSSESLYNFLLPMIAYVLGYDVVLLDGETIGFTEEQKIKITNSKGVHVEGMSLKLQF